MKRMRDVQTRGEGEKGKKKKNENQAAIDLLLLIIHAKRELFSSKW